jgi:predicted short-subunit dehydrogenase-like oxidoreductase (DUF2520 family)
MALALTSVGYPLDALVARRKHNAVRASKQLDVSTVTLTERELHLLAPSQIIIIATPDDVIEDVARRLAKTQPRGDGRVVLHTSGALSSTVLAPLDQKGFATGSLHPLIAVSDRLKGVPTWKGAFWCVEGQRAAVQSGRRIVRDLGGRSFSIRPESKALYHAAALMVSGQMVALFDVAIGMLIKSGLTAANARRILLPLVQSNSRNLERFDPAHALTGTFARGDLATVQRHLKALSTSGLTEALALYRILGIRSVSLAHQNKTNARALKQIKKLLLDG